MQIGVEQLLRCWMPALKLSLGRRTAEAVERMRPVIERAVRAEREGRISDMYPSMASCNSTADIAAGWWRLEIRYRPVTNGEKGDRTSWITDILKP